MSLDKQYDVLVFIGRFSPLHCGHEAVIKKALTLADRVVVLVGSSHSPRDVRNPWTYTERSYMIKNAFKDFSERLIVKPLPDYPYDDNKWMSSVRSLAMTGGIQFIDNPKIGLIGHNKDHTSYYLKMFPDWETVEVENYADLNSTDIRKIIFNSSDITATLVNFARDKDISHSTLDSLTDIIFDKNGIKQWFKDFRLEWNLIKKYKQQWQNVPYPVIFQTVDSVVVQSSHILLVKRKSAPGMGLWALPGGFLDVNETLLDGAIRELKEETKLKIPIPVLKGSIEECKTFDDPHRSTRGRTITTAYYINLGFDKKLPKVVGSDDAEKAVWVPFDKVNSVNMFEDHFHIIDYFTNIG